MLGDVYTMKSQLMKTLLLLLPLLCLLASPAWAAISCGDAVEDATTSVTDPDTVSVTTPDPCVNCILLVGTAERDTVHVGITATHAGNNMTSTTTGVVTNSPANAQLFYIVAPTAGTNDVSVGWGAAGPLTTAIVAWFCSGVDQASPVHDATEAAADGTAVSVTVPNLVAGDVVVDMMMGDEQAAEPTVGANQTVLHVGQVEADELGYGASYQLAADGGEMTWTIGISNDWVITAVALTAAADTILQSSPVPFTVILGGD